MRRSCCIRAIGSSVPSRESSTRKRCCRSPKIICEVRVLAPFSLSLCCTRSERRIVWLLQPNPFLSSMRAGPYPHGIKFVPRTVKETTWWLQRIMFRLRDAVKFGACGVCPKCNSSPGRVRRESDDVGISGTQRGVGTLRTNVRARTRAACRFAGPHDERASPGRAAWRVLHESAESNFAGDGSADDQPGAGARERISAIGDGRIAAGKTKILKTQGRNLSFDPVEFFLAAKPSKYSFILKILNPLLRLQEGIQVALMADGGDGTVAGVDDGVVRQVHQSCAKRLHDLVHRT